MHSQRHYCTPHAPGPLHLGVAPVMPVPVSFFHLTDQKQKRPSFKRHGERWAKPPWPKSSAGGEWTNRGVRNLLRLPPTSPPLTDSTPSLPHVELLQATDGIWLTSLSSRVVPSIHPATAGSGLPLPANENSRPDQTLSYALGGWASMAVHVSRTGGKPGRCPMGGYGTPNNEHITTSHASKRLLAKLAHFVRDLMKDV